MYFLKKIVFTPEKRPDKQCVYRNDDYERVDQSSKFHDFQTVLCQAVAILIMYWKCIISLKSFFSNFALDQTNCKV